MSITPITIDAGSRNGVKRGMMFFLVDSGDNFNQILKINGVGLLKSRGVVIRRVDKDGNEAYEGKFEVQSSKSPEIPFPILKVGIKLTTSPIDAFK
jgi:hypothetical protein